LAGQLDFKIVLVSPLRRAIQSAYFIFKEHPHFAQIRFVLAPLARERLSGAGEIPLDLTDVLQEFNSLFPSGLDTSLFREWKGDINNWYLDGLDSTVQEQIMANSKTQAVSATVYEIMQYTVTNRLQGVESMANVHGRFLRLSQQIKELTKGLKDGDKVALVSH
jgi:broad specificity phosphatase PhoE